ncbi:hypothetical protein KP509_06G073500 [Ceratopteris richardii]|uniref:Retrovirus-related Pol polyprotein from transposon TNT 1-94 n=1 Tax=Ceratopteris richardii TaxID=49495 RepID=A0A8T2UHR2_CERRI|nr:hypothetical protein KP509_06G073500 [Ceratopteris richardii]
MTSNPIFHARTKHIEVHYHYVREKAMNNEVQVSFVGTKDQVVDIFTKSLDGPKLQRFNYILGMKEIPFET